MAKDEEVGCFWSILTSALIGGLLVFLQSHSIWIGLSVIALVAFIGVKANRAIKSREGTKGRNPRGPIDETESEQTGGWTRKGGVRYRELPRDGK